ncbi:MAG: phosphate acyltransferase PlsX [Burkholderiaceae bacterium]|nr:phosphate acyltransferase PlsX [Burkholderiaceae bacterium]
MTVRIAIDCMGGDHGLSVTVPAAISLLRGEPEARLLLVGDRAAIEAALGGLGARERERIEIRHASEVVQMDDPPAVALRTKRQSSMRLAVEAVKAGECDACVSAGNTGALMAISRFVLKMLDGIDRPAIATQLPNQAGRLTTMLDLGANVDCGPEHLVQFAIMGSALVTALDGTPRPSVGLLNIGEEVIKGNDTVKRAGELLRECALNFAGNVEGNDIYRGEVDVVVCDGFVGNVALKTSEGLAQMLGGFIREEYERHLFTRLMALLSMPVLRRFKQRVDHRRYNGAALVGLRGVVIKSHGSADAYGFESALRRAFDAVRNGLLERIVERLPEVQGSLQNTQAPGSSVHSDVSE